MSATQSLLQPASSTRAGLRGGAIERLASALWQERAPIALGMLVAIAWTALLATLWGAPSAEHTAATPWWCMADMSSGSSRSGIAGAVLAGLPMWALMSTAMMLPACVPAVRRCARASIRPWRAVTVFTSTYLLGWLAFGVAALCVRAASPVASELALIAALMTAAAWQLSLPKRRALAFCRSATVLGPQGGRAVLDTARIAVHVSAGCLASCWAIMLAMAMVGSDQLIWAVGLTTVVSAEKLMGTPGRVSRCSAAVFAAVAVDLTIATLV